MTLQAGAATVAAPALSFVSSREPFAGFARPSLCMGTWTERLEAAPRISSGTWPVHQIVDFFLAFLGWAAIVVSSAVLPVEDLGVRSVALYLHLIFVPVGFGAVVMMNVYAVLLRMGRQTVRDVVALTSVAHQLMAVGLGGLTATGIALDPDLDSPLMRAKLLLLLVLMLNAVRVQESTRRIVGPVVVSQIAWWGTIGIGYIITTAR